MDVSGTNKVKAVKVETDSQSQQRATQLAREKVVRDVKPSDQRIEARESAQNKKVSSATNTEKPRNTDNSSSRPKISNQLSQAMVQKATVPPPPEPEPESRQTRAEAAKPIEVSRDGVRSDSKIEF
jgi:hypothetical protein